MPRPGWHATQQNRANYLAAWVQRRARMPQFWDLVDTSGGPDACWLWTGHITTDGYGDRWASGKMVLAHRVAYELAVGPIPAGLHIDHLCRVRACVNPAHLEAVTPGENTRRAHLLPFCRNGHEMAVHARTRPNGKRCCRLCEQAYRRRIARRESDCGHVDPRYGCPDCLRRVRA